MLQRNSFPLLEFDPDTSAKIEPSKLVGKKDVPKACVITFFAEAIRHKLEEGLLQPVTAFRSQKPIYETLVGKQRVGLSPGYVGAPGAACQLEELIAMGFEKFIVCGGAGVLQKDIQVGHLVVPYAAVRDEGTSYHYIAPSREVACSIHALSVIEDQLEEENLPYIKAKTWTTDAPYRETEGKIALRASEGCVTVEMEAAAFFAVARFRGVELGQILYGGDDLTGKEWDPRQWDSRTDIRENLINLCLRIAARL